ncbi:MAG TPA: hypothetical protein VGJ84_00710 [Polyangiaceae bacterium]|jgi:hypothetical protein
MRIDARASTVVSSPVLPSLEKIGSANAPAVPEPESSEAAAPQGSASAPFATFVSRLGKELDRGEHMMSRVISGSGLGQLGPADLIALQAGVYRYSEAVDLATRFIDRLTSSVRVTLTSNQG